MKFYFKRILRVFFLLEINKEYFFLKLNDKEMGCEGKCENIE